MSKQVVDLINNSFLSEQNRKRLLDILTEGGESPSFYQEFNQLLINEVNKRKGKFEKVITNFHQQLDKLEKDSEQKRQELDKQLEKDLQSIDISDIKAKTEIFDDYYKKIASFQQKQIEATNNFIASATASAID